MRLPVPPASQPNGPSPAAVPHRAIHPERQAALLAVGYDLSQLVVGLADAGRLDPAELPAVCNAVVPAYRAGLAAEGITVDADVVRFGCHAALAVRSALTALPLDGSADADALAHRTRLICYLVDLGLALRSPARDRAPPHDRRSPMPVSRTPSGTRGAKMPPNPLRRALMPVMTFVRRRSGDRFRGGDLLYLTTVGARTGQRRHNPVGRYDDGQGGWLVVASFGGAAQHPGWYHNIVAHPDEVWAEVAGTTYHVRAEQLTGPDRERAWAVITEQPSSFLGYEQSTDRELPLLRPVPAGAEA